MQTSGTFSALSDGVRKTVTTFGSPFSKKRQPALQMAPGKKKALARVRVPAAMVAK
ncbi:MAG: hypothetical protein ABL982_03535 [Vicinamibacterales bacterium]